MLNGSLTLSDLNILRGDVFNDMGCELRNQSLGTEPGSLIAPTNKHVNTIGCTLITTSLTQW